MPTLGQADYLHANIQTLIGLLFVAVYSFAIGLILWHSIYNSNPVANALAGSLTASITND